MADTNAMSISVDDAPADLVVSQAGITHLVTGLIPIAAWLKNHPSMTGVHPELREAFNELSVGLRMSGLTDFFQTLPNE